MDVPPTIKAIFRPHRELVRGWIALALVLAPALAAIAWVPEFATQDGPAHLYNARILNASLRSDSPFAETLEVAWRPLPNWTGHLGTMGLVATFRPDVAGRLLAAFTMVAFAASVFWLRWVVAGERGLVTAAILAGVLALNVTWLLGFTGFLLGAALMSATLAVWWGGREWFGPVRALGLSALLVLGYFSHPISLGLTVVGLGLLSLMTPGMNRAHRAFWTAASLLPMVPLGLAYRALTRSGGGLEPVWQHLGNPWSARSWLNQLGWVDPISLAGKSYLPFLELLSPFHGLASPAIWAAVGVVVLVLSSWRGRAADRRGWLALAALLLVGGLLGPDTMGARHGHYLPQRVVLLGLVALVPWLDLGGRRRAVQVATGMLGLALAVQSAFVWDYAFECRDRVGSLLKAGPAIGTRQRVGTLLLGIKGRFRSNPMLHADCLFGVGGDNLIWNNYETAHYYFPVKVRSGLDHPPATVFEKIALLEADDEAQIRADGWARLIEEYSGSIDVILEWSRVARPRFDAIESRAGFVETFREGPVRVWTRQVPTISSQGSE